MDLKLIVEQGRTKSREVSLRSAETIIGRAEGSGLRIASAEVSRRHCVLRVRNDTVTIEDLGSSNGTQVNGRSIISRQVLKSGDRLKIGPVTFLVQLGAPRAERNVTPPVPARVAPKVDQLEILDDLPLAALDDESPDAEVMEDTDSLAPIKVDEEEHLPMIEAERVEDIPEAWALPQDNDMRGLLAGLDDDEDPRQSGRQ